LYKVVYASGRQAENHTEKRRGLESACYHCSGLHGVRMSTIIGLAGDGIGFLLVQYIRLLDYRSAGIAVWFIAITVAALNYINAEIRERFA
jgi:hypothetical protein